MLQHRITIEQTTLDALETYRETIGWDDSQVIYNRDGTVTLPVDDDVFWGLMQVDEDPDKAIRFLLQSSRSVQ